MISFPLQYTNIINDFPIKQTLGLDNGYTRTVHTHVHVRNAHDSRTHERYTHSSVLLEYFHFLSSHTPLLSPVPWATSYPLPPPHTGSSSPKPAPPTLGPSPGPSLSHPPTWIHHIHTSSTYLFLTNHFLIGTFYFYILLIYISCLL